MRFTALLAWAVLTGTALPSDGPNGFSISSGFTIEKGEIPVSKPMPKPLYNMAQVRVYDVSSDGRNVGEYTQTITPMDDGETYDVQCSSDVHVRINNLLIKRNHDYTYRGHETWIQGRLLYLDGKFNENGASGSAKASANNNHDWSTSYWQLPAEECHNRTIQLLDAGTGEVYNVTLKHVGNDQYGHHYQVRGQMNVDLWYDDQGRLNRREMVRNGKNTVLQIRALQKTPQTSQGPSQQTAKVEDPPVSGTQIEPASPAPAPQPQAPQQRRVPVYDRRGRVKGYQYETVTPSVVSSSPATSSFSADPFCPT